MKLIGDADMNKKKLFDTIYITFFKKKTYQ